MCIRDRWYQRRVHGDIKNKKPQKNKKQIAFEIWDTQPTLHYSKSSESSTSSGVSSSSSSDSCCSNSSSSSLFKRLCGGFTLCKTDFPFFFRFHSRNPNSLFGVLICLSEVGTRCILQYFNFLSHLPGKGWFLLFVGSFLIWDVAYWGFYVGIGCAVCGLIYIIISCQALQAICQHIFCHGYKYEKVDNP
eukprot:TRINITY_DN1980_c0_g1_i2.p2 TRINITY_DN1980_c0_g1~~TRINITY_DN1980_c0_g1_i2.p2  ORF type:complete len:190 (+),score=20.22 TRINITY_DN1980_c0_g1_i2:84-653(+)